MKKKTSEKIEKVVEVKHGPIERDMMKDAESSGSYGIGNFKPSSNVEWPK